MNRLCAMGFSLLLLGAGAPAAAVPHDDAAWPDDLRDRLERIDAAFAGDIGVFVQDIDSGRSVSLRGAESWYLASGIKVFVAIAVLRLVDAGVLALDTQLVLEEGDLVDGAGPTALLYSPGARLRVDYLVEQMLVVSDNTATDMLIRRAGIARVNAVAAELALVDEGAITTLADVRRRTYGGFHANAAQLGGRDLLALRRARDEPARLVLLATLLGVAPSEFALGDIDTAFAKYYASGLNAAPLDGYARMLRQLAEGKALGASSTRHLLAVLARVQTGAQRIRAGLPAHVTFAHKTGTQHRRACDFGIATAVRAGERRRLVVAACTRGEASLAQSERALREIGSALARSGALGPPPPANRSMR